MHILLKTGKDPVYGFTLIFQKHPCFHWYQLQCRNKPISISSYYVEITIRHCEDKRERAMNLNYILVISFLMLPFSIPIG